MQLVLRAAVRARIDRLFVHVRLRHDCFCASWARTLSGVSCTGTRSPPTITTSARACVGWTVSTRSRGRERVRAVRAQRTWRWVLSMLIAQAALRTRLRRCVGRRRSHGQGRTESRRTDVLPHVPHVPRVVTGCAESQSRHTARAGMRFMPAPVPSPASTRPGLLRSGTPSRRVP